MYTFLSRHLTRWYSINFTLLHAGSNINLLLIAAAVYSPPIFFWPDTLAGFRRVFADSPLFASSAVSLSSRFRKNRVRVKYRPAAMRYPRLHEDMFLGRGSRLARWYSEEGGCVGEGHEKVTGD